MRSFWSDPFLWIHLAGIAAVPIWLELCWLGLAAGNPVLPFWLELLVLAAIGIVPIFWMQWQRPFYIFSLIGVALKPAQLTEDQRRLLSLFKAQRNRFLAIAAAIIAFLALRQLYYLAPIAAPVTPFTSESRWLGLLVTAIAFLGVNLFLQVPISVLSVMLTGESVFATTTPYSLEQIRSDFTLLGVPVNQILPPVVAEPEPIVADASLGVTSPPAPEIPASETAAESIASGTEDGFEASVTPATIPDGELERITGDTLAELITTEEDLKADLWDVEAAIALGSPAQEIIPPSVASDTDSETPIDSAAIPPEEFANSVVVDQPEAIADEAISNSVEADHLEEPVDPLEVVNPEVPTDSEVITDSEASIPPGEIVSSEAISNAEELTSVEAIPSDEATSKSEAVDNSATIADSEAPTPETSADPGETLNPEMVASAPTEAPLPDPETLPSTHHTPEDQKE